MKPNINKLLDVFLYCGLTRKEYKSLKREIYISNFNVWKILHVFILIGFAVLAVFFSIHDPNSLKVKVDIAMVIYSAFMTYLFFAVLKEDSLVAQLLIYLTMAILMVSSLLIRIGHPNSVSITFIIMLVSFPMLMADHSVYMALFNVSAICIYLGVEYQFVNSELFRPDVIYSCIFGTFGILLHIFYNNIRVRELNFHRQNEKMISEELASGEETKKLNETLKRMSESVVDLLGEVVESRDEESGIHVRRVKGFTNILAKEVMKELPEYGLDDYTVDLMTFTSSLHDVGKISIPDSILNKPGKLTAEEFEIMKTHCEKGCVIINKMEDKWSRDYLDMGLDIALYHHEKWDGRGYPKGLKGDEIPIAAQIVSIADCYDALTTKRVYKDAYPPEKAFQMILDGECGVFSEKLLSCFRNCREAFESLAAGAAPDMRMPDFELVSKANPEESFVIGLHDQNRTLREKIRLSERVSVLESLSEDFFYVCYVNMVTNELIRFKADKRIARILDSFGENLRSNEKFDKLLNTIILAEDFPAFREATNRQKSLELLEKNGQMFVDFRIRLEDGVHYCRIKVSLSQTDKNAVIIGIAIRDKEHEREAEYLSMQQELENAKKEIENREKLADRLAVIDSISSEYDYVCSLNAKTMEVTVYRAEAWIRDMFKNLEDIVTSPQARDTVLKGIIYPDDFEEFKKASLHENVMKGLQKNGRYNVDYRAYKYGNLVKYQTNYTLDKNNPGRIIIGLRCLSQ